MRICIFGAGSVGSFLAAMLIRAGRDVSVIARGAHLQAMQSHGLTLRNERETFRVSVPAYSTSEQAGPHDIVIVSTKTTALAALARQFAPLLHRETQVVFAVNGVFWFYDAVPLANGATADLRRLDPQGLLRSHVGVHRAHGMVIRSPNEVVEPGVVQNKGGGRFALGPALAGNARASAILVQALSEAGLAVTLAGDLRLEMWKKLVRNSIGLLATLADASSRDVVLDPECGPLAGLLMREVAAVAVAQGYAPSQFDIERELDKCRNGPSAIPSLLQDLRLGRPMEIDTLFLAVMDLARQCGVATPMLDALVPALCARARRAGAR